MRTMRSLLVTALIGLFLSSFIAVSPARAQASESCTFANPVRDGRRLEDSIISGMHAVGDGALPGYVANGLIGLRVREMPLMAGMTLVNGVVGENPERRVEAAAPVPYPLAADLCVNGVWMSDQPWAVSDLRQAYDFATGELTSRCRVRLGGVDAAIEILTLASRTAPTLVMQEIHVRPDAPCHMRLRAVVATTDLRGRVARRRTDTPGEPEPACDGSLL